MSPETLELAARELCRLRGWDPDAPHFECGGEWATWEDAAIEIDAASDPQVVAAIRTAMGEAQG
jgi:hypothetical protein